MDFFKSVFSAPPAADIEEEEEPEETAEGPDGSPGGAEEEAEEGEMSGDGGAASWSGFSGLIRTLASKSESVIQTYRRDLEEFGTGLRKETAAIREAIVRDLPSSLEVGASAAQESLESVGQAIDDFGGSVWRGTAEIIAQGKDALLSMDADAATAAAAAAANDPSSSLEASAQGSGAAASRYNRFEAKVLGIQSDPATFSEEPEDTEDFRAWIAGFQMPEKAAEIGSLLAESRALESNLARLVPDVVDYETFWSRYFYKVHKLKQAEDMRANLVKRVISREEEEEDLSWEVDDDDVQKDGDGEEQKDGQELGEKQGEERGGRGEEVGVSTNEEVHETPDPALGEKLVKSSENEVEIASVASGENVPSETMEDDRSEFNISEPAVKLDDKMLPEGKGEPVESCKDSDVSVVSSQPSMPEEDDLGWDEIEDLGENDEKKVGVSSGSPVKIDLRKKLNTADEDEDLSWDIEDDEPIKP